MMLTPTLKSLPDLVHKLERECWRTWHHRNLVHKADHFYNFCVTAHAFRDYFLETKGITDKKCQDSYHTEWNQIPELQAAADIANSSKHFNLRKSPATRLVSLTTAPVVDIYLLGDGSLKRLEVPNAPEISVTLSDGEIVELYQFMEKIIKYWREYLAGKGIVIEKQSEDEFFGRPTEAS